MVANDPLFSRIREPHHEMHKTKKKKERKEERRSRRRRRSEVRLSVWSCVSWSPRKGRRRRGRDDLGPLKHLSVS